MRSILEGRPSPAMVVALIALFVALGGTSYAVATGSIGSREIKDNSLRSRDIRNGQLQAADIKNGALTQKDLSRGAIEGLRGMQGQRGPVGPPGPAGASAARYFATVRSNGGLASGTATSAQRIGAGAYDVVFPADVSRCSGVVTPGVNQPASGAIDDAFPHVYVGGRHTGAGTLGPKADTVAVDFYSPADLSLTVDTGFHLALLC